MTFREQDLSIIKEILDLESLAFHYEDLDETAKAKRCLAKAKKLRATLPADVDDGMNR